MKIEGTRVFESLWEALVDDKINGVVLYGGSRSSKGHSIIQAHGLSALGLDEARFIIARLKRTWVKSTTLKDFKKVFSMYDWWNEDNFHKSDLIYTFNSNTFEFIGLDETQKLHGLEADYFWCNEAIELPRDDFDQIEQRLLGKWILDFNPTDPDHWMFDLRSRDDVVFIHSTMVDNPFLPQKIINKLKSYEPTPENYKRNTVDEYKWKVYGLGEPARLEGVIFDGWEIVKKIPEAKLIGIGMDFGFTNDPTAVIEVYINGGELWLNELIYEEGLTNQDIGRRLRELEVKGNIIADSAEPKSIREIEIQGFRIEGAEKGPDSIRNGIDILKRYKLNITENSLNLIKELKNYAWAKDRTGKTTGKPVDNWNHGIDAVRYVALNKINRKFSGKYVTI